MMRSLGLIEPGILQPGGAGQEMRLQDAYFGRDQGSGILFREQGLSLINACMRSCPCIGHTRFESHDDVMFRIPAQPRGTTHLVQWMQSMHKEDKHSPHAEEEVTFPRTCPLWCARVRPMTMVQDLSEFRMQRIAVVLLDLRCSEPQDLKIYASSLAFGIFATVGSEISSLDIAAHTAPAYCHSRPRVGSLFPQPIEYGLHYVFALTFEQTGGGRFRDLIPETYGDRIDGLSGRILNPRKPNLMV